MKLSFHCLRAYRSVRRKLVPKTDFPVQSDWDGTKLFTTLKHGCVVIMGFCIKEPLSLPSLLMGITVGFIRKKTRIFRCYEA
jgi:hypothetical protein